MPATSKVDFDKFVEIAKKYNLQHENSNSIKGPSDKCWLDISEELKYSISSKYAYIIVRENRNNVCNKLFPNVNSIRVEKCDNAIIYDDLQSSCSSETSNDDTLNFNITLSADEWESLYNNNPQIYKRSDVKSGCRLYYTLHPHKWTSVMHEFFYEQTKLPCSIVYKNAKIYQEGQVFLKMSGYCSACESILTGILTSCPTQGSRVIIRCTLKRKFKSCRTNRKRRIIGDKKVNYVNKLKQQNQSAAFIQRNEAKSIMDY